ncbi:probable serine/threonine-protein kinase MARK-A isoform X1 [Ptychodera flava]|uniref:probable serine/threonine-protein kinase MARK-A isoform X1 n=1 Tax=Ptychodera flava TaxID=63121 RepID=UPI003969E969
MFLMTSKAAEHVLVPLAIEKTDDFIYFVMPLMEYNLSEVVEDRLSSFYPSDGVQLKMATQFLTGLLELHQLGIIHRDLKPSNILQDIHGDLKIADFGISNLLRHGMATYQTVIQRGTLCWMSSEMINKQTSVKKSADVQIAGCILYYIFSDGHHPFEDSVPYHLRPELIMINMSNGTPKLIHCVPNLQWTTDLIVKPMIHKDPEKRPSIEACLNALVTQVTVRGQSSKIASSDFESQDMVQTAASSQQNENPVPRAVSSQQNENPVPRAVSSQQNENPVPRAVSSQQNENPVPRAVSSQQNEKPVPRAVSSQQNENPVPRAVSSQQNENPVPRAVSSQQNENPVPRAVSSQQNENPVPRAVSSQQNENPVPRAVSSQQNESPVPRAVSSQQNENPVPRAVSSQQNENPVPRAIPSQQNENPVPRAVSSQQNESPAPTAMSSQQNKNPVPTAAISQQNESPAPIATSSQQNENSVPRAVSSQQNESPAPIATSSQQNKNPVPTAAISQQNESPAPIATSSQQNENPVPTAAISQQNESPVPRAVSSQQHESPAPIATSSQQNKNPVPTAEISQQNKSSAPIVVSSQQYESSAPTATSLQQNENPVPRAVSSQQNESPAPIATSSQKNKNPVPTVAVSQQNKSSAPTATSFQQNENPVPRAVSSQQNESSAPIATSSQKNKNQVPQAVSSQQNENPVPTAAISQQNESPAPTVVSSQQYESPAQTATSSQQNENPVPTATSSQLDENPVPTAIIISSQKIENPASTPANNIPTQVNTNPHLSGMQFGQEDSALPFSILPMKGCRALKRTLSVAVVSPSKKPSVANKVAVKDSSADDTDMESSANDVVMDSCSEDADYQRDNRYLFPALEDMEDESSGTEYLPSSESESDEDYDSDDDYESDDTNEGQNINANQPVNEHEAESVVNLGEGEGQSINANQPVNEHEAESVVNIGQGEGQSINSSRQKVNEHKSGLGEASLNKTGITVKYVSRNAQGKRIQDKVHYCYYCDKKQTHIARHLKLKHKDEKEVAEALTYPSKSIARLRSLRLIVNKGNKAHNMDVLTKQCGTFVTRRQPSRKLSAKRCFLFCVHCHGMFINDTLHRHERVCPFKRSSDTTTARGHQIQSRAWQLMPMPKDVTEDFWKVLTEMKRDEIRSVVMEDPLIRMFGEKLFKKHGRLETGSGKIIYDTAKNDYIRQRLRECGRLVLAARNFGLLKMEDILSPKNFRAVAKAVKVLGGYNGVSYEIPSLVLKTGNNLKALCDIAMVNAMINNDDGKYKQAEHFKKICEAEWNAEISAGAITTLNEANGIKQQCYHHLKMYRR